MDINELTVLRTGLKLFAGSVAEVARRAKVTPAYVSRTLRGLAGENATTLLIIEKANEVYKEYSKTNSRLTNKLADLK